MIKEHNLIKKDDNIINFDAARKGLSFGGSGIDENWLKAMPVGTVFLCRPKDRPKNVGVLDMYAVLEHKVVTTNLAQKIPDGRQADFWFVSLEFSRQNTWIETIAEVEFKYETPKEEEKETATETTDGNSPGSV